MSVTSVITSKVSLAARLRRHERVFGRNGVIASVAKKSHSSVLAAADTVAHYTGVKLAAHVVRSVKAKHRTRVVAPTAGTLYRRLGAITLGIVTVSTVFGSAFDVSYAQYGSDEYLNQINQEGTLVADQDGYFTKANPQTIHTERTFKDRAQYAVDSGDSLSIIAQRFDITSETLMWENDLSMTSVLRVGQKLNIPPTNGISHRVASGQSVEKIASLYKVDSQKIVAMNGLESRALAQGQIIFVPDAKPLPQAKPIPRTIAKTSARAPARDAPARNVPRTALSNANATPAAGRFLIFPTIGSLTQGFHSGHYAYDIGNRSMPPIWAAASGTVIKASSGTWGGGYGNHVIIDHGNGVKTLYAHMSYLTVNVGDHVDQGQVVGRMGKSGNVRGITGIHLHFEVIDHGVKKAPGRYY